MISGRTGVLAIIADPVVQAMAPTFTNAACAERGLDLVMVPLAEQIELLLDFMTGACAGR